MKGKGIKGSASQSVFGPMFESMVTEVGKHDRSIFPILMGGLLAFMAVVGGATGAAVAPGHKGLAIVIGLIVFAAIMFVGLRVGVAGGMHASPYQQLVRLCKNQITQIVILGSHVAFLNTRGVWTYVPLDASIAYKLADWTGIPINDANFSEGEIEWSVNQYDGGGCYVYIKPVYEAADFDPLEVYIAGGTNKIEEASNAIQNIVLNLANITPDPDCSPLELSEYQVALEAEVERSGINKVIATPEAPYTIRRLFVHKVVAKT